MKNRYIWALLPALLGVMGMASCDNDALDMGSQEDTDELLVLNGYIDNSAQTRAQVELGNYADNTEYVLWNEGDAFSLYDLGEDGTTTPTTSFTFTITDYSDASPSNSASFSGACNISTGNQIKALYPAQDEADAASTLTLSIPTSIAYGAGTDEEVGAGMAPYMYMYASAQMQGSGTSLSFNHLTSMIRITYQNQSSEEQSISEVKVTGDGAYFGTTIDFSLADAEQELSESGTTIGATFDGLTVAAGDTLDVYLLFFPGDDFNEGGSLTFSVDGQDVGFNTSVLQTSGFQAGGRCWFDLTQTDEGLAMTNNYVVYDDYVLIYSSVNAALCQALADVLSDVSLDDGGNAIVPISLIESTTTLSLSNQSLTSLDGLECFENLQELTCNQNSLNSLNASRFPDLTKLNCANNNLTSIDVSGCTALGTLYCYTNNLTSLDVSGLGSLSILYCNNNDLTSLDVSGCTALTSLSCFTNNLTSLDVSGFTSLKTLSCYSNELTSLDVSGCTALSTLSCYDNNLSSLEVSGFTSLSSLSCGSNDLTSLDLSGCTALSSLSCGNNNLTSLVVSGCTSLKSLSFSGNDLTSLDASGCSALTTLNCYNNYLTSLDVSGCTALRSLYCYGNILSTLDVSECSSLSILRCGLQYADVEKSSYQYMVLTLTSEQNSKWSTWSTNYYNYYVTASIVE